MPRLPTIAIAAFVVLFACAHADAANGEKPLLAVVPFTGPQAKQAEAVVVRTLRKKAAIVPQTTWLKAARKLFAPSHSSEDIAAVAEDVGAEVVITGIVKRDGTKWQLIVSVRDGKSGKTRERLRYPLKAPRMNAETLALLGTEIGGAFDSTVNPDAKPADAKSPEGKTPEAKAPDGKAPEGRTPEARTPEARTPATRTPDARTPEAKATARQPEVKPIDDTPLTASSTEPPPPVLSKSEKPPATTGRPRWAPYFDISAAATLTGRSFDFDPASQPKFSSGIVAGIRGDVTLYPLAFTWNKAHGVFSGLGLGATVDKPFWPDSTSKQDPTQKFATTELRAEGGLRWRLILYKSLPLPQLLINAGAGLHSFALSKDATGGDVGPADVNYKYATFGAGMRVHFAEWAYLWAMFDYHIVFDSGPIADLATEYGPTKSFGVRVRGGLDFFVYKGLKLGAEGYYERFSLKFDPGAAMPAKVANGGTDQYFGGIIVVGYVL
ncbi:MAG: hypothetical protein JWN44_2580 [Myxococcales bacterium]|nr:hypothetical protein [Myxococcales bacterium]